MIKLWFVCAALMIAVMYLTSCQNDKYWADVSRGLEYELNR